VDSGIKKSGKGFKYPSPLVFGLVRVVCIAISKIFWFLRFRGVENIPQGEGGLLLVSNHPTYIDPVWISLAVKKNIRYMAWDEAFQWPVVGGIIRYLGAFPVKTHAGVTKTAIVESLRTLRGNGALVIFPEGEREFSDGKMLEFKSGAVHIAVNAGVPILPVSIRGGNRIWPQGQKFPSLFHRVEIIYHPPMHLPERPDDMELDDYLDRLNRELIETIESGIKM